MNRLHPWRVLSPAPAVVIVSNTLASPSVFTTATAHNLQVGDKVTIAGNSVASCNGANLVVASIPTALTFTCTGVNAASAGTGGTVVRTAIIHTKVTTEQWIQNEGGHIYAALLIDCDNQYHYTVYGTEDPNVAYSSGVVLATAADQTATSGLKLISGIVVANFPWVGLSVLNDGADVSTIVAKLSFYNL